MLRRDVLKSAVFLTAYTAEFIMESSEEKLFRTLSPLRKDFVRLVSIETDTRKNTWKYKFVYFVFSHSRVDRITNKIYLRVPTMKTMEVEVKQESINHETINRRLGTEVFDWKGFETGGY